MADEIQGEFLIVGYVDAIEEAVHDGKKTGIPEELINDMYAIHGDIVELEPCCGAGRNPAVRGPAALLAL